MQENRLLLYQQRLLAKQIEELQGSKVDTLTSLAPLERLKELILI